MGEQLNLVCLPFHDYKIWELEGYRTRDAHLFQHFVRDSRIRKIIVLNRPTLAVEVALRRKSLHSAANTLNIGDNTYVTRVSERLWVIDVLDWSVLKPVIQLKAFLPSLYARNGKRFRRALKSIGVNEFVTYESSPLTVECASTLCAEHRIFDAVDNLCKHSTYQRNAEALRRSYRFAIDSYDQVYFNSNDSLAYFSDGGLARGEMLANGVDPGFFRYAGPAPAELEKLRRPLIVYAGKMQEMLDIGLVKEVAARLPHATFLFLGKVLLPSITLALRETRNVVFGGDIRYDLLPAFIAEATVCIIPYRVEKQHGGDPIKFYEYMAAGKSIVATPIGDIERYSNGGSISVVDRVDFADALVRAVSAPQETRFDLPVEMTWEFKARLMITRALTGVPNV